jgi:hypothetical protein
MRFFSFVGCVARAAHAVIFMGGLVTAASAQTAQPPAEVPKPADSAISNPGVPTRVAPTSQDTPNPQDKRIFGVLPNYRTADGTQVFVPLTTAQKFHIAVKDSFDWPGFMVAAAFAGLYQEENQNPSFGQGIKGYAHRYVTAYADQVSGNMMTEAILPTLLHEDPRYFRRVTGTVTQRTIYAITRVLITRTDSGGTGFNVAEILGNGVAASIGNAYYPDNRGFGDTFQRMGTAIATDTFSDILKEFWPDIKRRYFNKHAAITDSGPAYR